MEKITIIFIWMFLLSRALVDSQENVNLRYIYTIAQLILASNIYICLEGLSLLLSLKKNYQLMRMK